MKFLFSQLLFFIHGKPVKRNIKILAKFLVFLLFTIILYSTLFHFIMEYEGRQYSWISGFYWTLTVMSTLGFGDITFTSDLGKVFSMIVMLSGIFFLLVMLPFTFIQFFYAPWLEAQARSRTPKDLPAYTTGHVIITNFDPIAVSLKERLEQYNIPYAIVLPDQQKAGELYELDYKVVVGELDRTETYQGLRINNASLIVVNNDDILNTNIISTIRELSGKTPIVTIADNEDSVDILELAGASHVFQLAKMLGRALVRQALGVFSHANIVGSFGQLLIVQTSAAQTSFEGKKLIESRIRELTGVNVIGLWQRGKFEIPQRETVINSTAMLLLAGSEEQFKQYNDFAKGTRSFDDPLLILGGGRVGQAVADALSDRGVSYCVVEKTKKLIKDSERYIIGSAADINTLKLAGIDRTPLVFITTHDDHTNIFLTIYCRKLRPDVQIISRATMDRNISKLYASGADFVMSYASMGANSIINILKPNQILMLSEGLDVFKFSVPPALIGKTIEESNIRKLTGCNIVAIHNHDIVDVNPHPLVTFKKGDELILIGTVDAEKAFIKHYITPNFSPL